MPRSGILLRLEGSAKARDPRAPGLLSRHSSHARQQHLPALPRLLESLAVLARGIAGLAGAQEAVAGAGVDHGLEGLAGLLHGLGRGLEAGGDARVALAVEAVDRTGDRRQAGLVLGRAAVEHERGRQVLAVRGELEGLAPAPAEARDAHLA